MGAGCSEPRSGAQDHKPAPKPPSSPADSGADDADPERGRTIWFENTYGGEKFFAFLGQHPDPTKRIEIAFEAMVETPRAQRFDVWGVINDPDCTADPAGGADLCPNPTATGVIGLRKFPDGQGGTIYGTACASCHAGFDPLNPPADPNNPEWDNIHATIGNQYMDIGAMFSANLGPDDVRRLMFAAWPRGTVDTTLLFNDFIMNPGVITAIWERDDRPRFDVGLGEDQLRNGQGGEDDVGGNLAAIRVYTNIGSCFFECVAGPVQTGEPIDVETCSEACADFPPTQDLDDLNAFLDTFEAPRYPGPTLVRPLYNYGKRQFEAACTSCHANRGRLSEVLSNDEINPLIADPNNATNACRALTSNWEAGQIWAQFSSQVYKDRAAAGLEGYRTMPLAGVWATTPFMHNQSIGRWAPVDASPRERIAYYWDAMGELLRGDREPVIFELPEDLGQLPAGTPLTYVFSRSPEGELLCDDGVENRGHHYGSELGGLEKVALTYWLQFQ